MGGACAAPLALLGCGCPKILQRSHGSCVFRGGMAMQRFSLRRMMVTADLGCWCLHGEPVTPRGHHQPCSPVVPSHGFWQRGCCVDAARSPVGVPAVMAELRDSVTAARGHRDMSWGWGVSWGLRVVGQSIRIRGGCRCVLWGRGDPKRCSGMW